MSTALMYIGEERRAEYMSENGEKSSVDRGRFDRLEENITYIRDIVVDTRARVHSTEASVKRAHERLDDIAKEVSANTAVQDAIVKPAAAQKLATPQNAALVSVLITVAAFFNKDLSEWLKQFLSGQ